MSAPTAASFTMKLLTQVGDPYVYGAEVRLSDPNPPRFDCSEFTEWGAAQTGGYLPDGAMNQLAYCRKHRTIIPVAQAIRTVGALLFHGPGRPHVVTSLGNGSTIEARGRAQDVGIFSATKGRAPWTAAALIPGYSYLPAGATPPPPTRPSTDVYAELAKLVTDCRTRTFGRDSSGPCVRLIQKKLQGFGQWVPETGVYDQATVNGVINVQLWCKLTADGVVGPQTWRILYP